MKFYFKHYKTQFCYIIIHYANYLKFICKSIKWIMWFFCKHIKKIGIDEWIRKIYGCIVQHELPLNFGLKVKQEVLHTTTTYKTDFSTNGNKPKWKVKLIEVD